MRYNSGVSFCAIECVAPTERAARQVADLVRDKLLGFMPTGAGELRPIGGQSYTSNETNAVPKKYISEVAFRSTITLWYDCISFERTISMAVKVKNSVTGIISEVPNHYVGHPTLGKNLVLVEDKPAVVETKKKITAEQTDALSDIKK